MEHVYGILLLYRSVYAAFVNTKWYEAWLERTLLLDPIIFDMWGPGVLSWAPGEHCNIHHARHAGQDTLVVLYLRCSSFLYHKSVGGRGCGQQPGAFFHQPELPRRRGESLVGVRVHHSFWLCLMPSLCVRPAEYRHCLCFFLVSAESRHCLCISAEYRHCFVFLLGFSCQQTQDEL